jgi:hypothetical protein
VSTYPPALGVPGDFYFHYTTREAAFEYILPDRQLRLSPAHLVQDPLESNPAFLGAEFGLSDNPEVDYENQVSAMEAGMRLQQLRRHSKVLSLTIDVPDHDGNAEVFGRGYARARMWQQYAENHQGVCLMFRRELLHAKALDEIQGRTAGAWADGVIYTERGILDNPAATLMPNPATTDADVVEQHIRNHLKSIFFTKLLDWETEHEYRFVEPSMDDGYTFVDIGDTLACVILGWKFPEWQAHGAFEMCQSVGATTWLMQWDRARPMPVQIGCDQLPRGAGQMVGQGIDLPGPA